MFCVLLIANFYAIEKFVLHGCFSFFQFSFSFSFSFVSGHCLCLIFVVDFGWLGLRLWLLLFAYRCEDSWVPCESENSSDEKNVDFVEACIFLVYNFVVQTFTVKPF